MSARERLRRQRVFQSPLVDIGVFRAPPHSDLFGAQQPPGHFAVAFPETSVRIRPPHGPAFVTDRNLVTLYEPEDSYDRGLVDPRGDHCTFIVPAPEIARQFAERARLTSRNGRVFGRAFELCSPTTFRRHRRLIHGLVDGKALPDATVEEEALRVLDGVAERSAAVVGRSGRRRPGPGARRSALRAREYLACHYAEAPGLSDIADAAGCSPYYLSRAFRQQFGTTLHRYRTDLALRDAYDRILATDDRLLEIALDLGFASHSHFSDVFRRRFAQRPSSLRRATRSRARSSSPRGVRSDRRS